MQYEVWPLIFNVQQIRYSSWFFHVKSLKIKVQGEKTIHMVIFLNTRPGKRPNFYMKVNVTEPRRKEFAALCMLRYVFAATRKKVMGKLLDSLGKGEFPSEHHSIPFSPYFHVCVPIWFFHYARVASRVIVKMNQEPLLLLCCPLLLFLYRL